MKYYKVVCICGHRGTKNYKTSICFYVEARNAIEAMNVGKAMPGVKHSRMPLSVVEIGETEYSEGRKVSAYARV